MFVCRTTPIFRPHLAPLMGRSISSSACLGRLSNVGLSGLIPATANDVEAFRSRLSGGFTAAHGVANGLTPLAFDELPPINSRGGRDVSGWRALYEGTVATNWTNLYGTMHGGCAAWIVDNLTGRAVETLGTETWWGPGVSMTLDMTYQSAAPIGTILDVLVTVDRMTGRVAYTRCDMFERGTGMRVASGNHVLMWKAPKSK